MDSIAIMDIIIKIYWLSNPLILKKNLIRTAMTAPLETVAIYAVTGAGAP
jgi:hypothetical protein